MRILVNGNFRTNNPDQPLAEAIAIEFGRILAAGTTRQIRADYGHLAEETDLAGKTVLPGLTDAHIHFSKYALFLTWVDCETDTKEECLRRVAERAVVTKTGAWVRGHAWNQNNWKGGFGSIQDLDAISTEIPIYLSAKSYHAGWANSAALHAAGIDANTPNPEGGVIVRDEHGHPTGILLESAMWLVEHVIPAPTLDELAAAMDAAQARLWSYGLTGLHDLDGTDCFRALQILDQAGKLRLRVIKGLYPEELNIAIQGGLRSGFGSDYLRIGPLKFMADGALGPHTAAMFQDYEGDPGNTGILFYDAEQMLEMCQPAVKAGYNVAIHAIGDRANHEVLNAYAQLRAFEAANGLPRLRHRIEHVQCLHPQDLQRLGKLGIVSSVQPIHATSDMYAADEHWGARSEGAYVFRTLLDSGSVLAFGSDAPVESPNPWLSVHAAVTRRRPDGSPNEAGWYPAQKLTIDETIRGFTSGPAYAAGLETVLGQLSAGQYADLIVLDEDPYTLPAEDLWKIQPHATMVGGDWVWQKG